MLPPERHRGRHNLAHGAGCISEACTKHFPEMRIEKRASARLGQEDKPLDKHVVLRASPDMDAGSTPATSTKNKNPSLRRGVFLLGAPALPDQEAA